MISYVNGYKAPFVLYWLAESITPESRYGVGKHIAVGKTIFG